MNNLKNEKTKMYKLIEECAQLRNELCKYQLKRTDAQKNEVINELIDVELLLEQVRKEMNITKDLHDAKKQERNIYMT
jgi:hypothetical protein